MPQIKQTTPPHRRAVPVTLFILMVLLLVLGGGFGVLAVKPSLAANGADVLRSLFGDDAVARLEEIVFQIQDRFHKLEYKTGAKPQPPWESSSLPTAPALPSLQPTFQSSPSTPPPVTKIEAGIPDSTATPTSPPVSTPSPTPNLSWCPEALPTSGALLNEGQWQPFITGVSGETIACRTFLQPDPERPYAMSAVIAFNLERARLHYVLGFDEPVSEVQIKRPATIPQNERNPGILLAVFNGGFKTRHGRFGVMMDGKVLLPPRDGLGTIAIYQDDRVQIGAWGTDITPDPGMVTWRQNGPLVIQDGEINPHTNDNSTVDWGSTVDGKGVVPTWRSALGISEDGKTLYFLAGPSLTMQALAQALKTARNYQAIQLDINNYWVFFGAFTFRGEKPDTVPLFKEMSENANRYLERYPRDFFYITAVDEP